jgi:hypothetical protein
MTNSLSQIERAQSQWALKTGRSLDRPGYVKDLADNLLRCKLSPQTETEFAKADGNELNDSGSRPAKMRALISSSALAVNFFDFWRDIPKGPITNALKLPAAITSLQFEHRCCNYPVGPKSPNLDLLLTLADGQRIGIESKFVEPYRGKDYDLLPKYFPPGLGYWSNAGLLRAQSLANEIRGRWKYLDAPQLLKHMLGLRSEQPESVVQLIYLWYDTGFDDAKAHREEVERFTDSIAGDVVRFSAISYQELFKSLRDASPDSSPGWAAYLAERYFKDFEAI